MSTSYHRHCQATVLPANGTGKQNGETWDILYRLRNTLNSLPSQWIEQFQNNTENITQDFASILVLLNKVAETAKSTGGTVKGVRINEQTKGPGLDGIVDLGNVTEGTVKYITINGEQNIPDESDGTVDLGNFVSQIKLNGTTNNPVNGLVDLGTISSRGSVNSIIVNGTSHTPNDSGIVDLGNFLTSDSNYVKKNGDTMTGFLTLHDDPTNDMHAATKKYVDDAVKNVSGTGESTQIIVSNVPIGTIIAWGGTMENIPNDYLCCDGTEVNQSEYPELYDVIGQNFGSASEGKFKLPKLNDNRFIEGYTQAGTAKDAGLPTPTVTLTMNHVAGLDGNSQQGYTSTTFGTRSTLSCNVKTDSIYGKSDTVQPKSLTTIYIICAKTPATEGGSSFDPTKFHTVFFNPGSATSIEFTSKSLYEGSKFGRLPTYTVNGEKMNVWYKDSDLTQPVQSTSIFEENDDIELYNSQVNSRNYIITEDSRENVLFSDEYSIAYEEQ